MTAGAVTGVAGGAADGTIVGLPVGVVLNGIGAAEGLTGGALVYWTDHTLGCVVFLGLGEFFFP